MTRKSAGPLKAPPDPADVTDVLSRLGSLARRVLPEGRPLDSSAWRSRHRAICAVLLAHAIGLPIYGVFQGITPARSVLYSAPLMLALVIASSDALSRRLRAATATLGLMTSSAVLVYLSNGLIESHFHFFVMLFVITLYQDWLTFLLAAAFVLFEHTVVGMLAPMAVYGHAHGGIDPLKWALIHATYISAAGAAAVANWRLTEQAQQAERQSAGKLSWEVSHDALTGTLNRREFERQIATALTETHADGAQGVVVVSVLDVDRFKIVNDTCGHPAGDELLVAVAGLLQASLHREDDALARLGGDEFGILVRCDSLEEALARANATCVALGAYRHQIGEHVFSLSVSIGMLALTPKVNHVEEILQLADAACYTAKEQGRGRVHLHVDDDEQQERRQSDSTWAGILLSALRDDRLELAYQPIVATDPTTPGRFGELLVRLRQRDGTLVSPGDFFPAAERYDLLPAIDRWVVANAFSALAGTYRPGAPTGGDLYSINLTGPSIGDETFLEFVRAQFLEKRIPPRLICFEITETVAITSVDVAVRFISELQGLGCLFALDDFGSGLSSFTYLKNLPVDFLKIDGAFVRTLLTDRIDREMVEASNRIGQSMGLRTIAEFVENDEIFALLREIGVDYGQGFALGRPRPLDQWLASLPPAKDRSNASVAIA